MARRVRRRKGTVTISLTPTEVELLADLAGQLTPMLEGGVPDRGADQGEGRVRDRLFPAAYLDPTEDAAEQEWQTIVHPDLVRGKRDALGALLESLDRGGDRGGDRRGDVEVVLEGDALERWLGALNDLRLALGVTLEVTEEMDGLPADDTRAPAFEVYRWLTWFQGELVETALGGGR